MALVCGLLGKDDLCIAGERQQARLVAVIRNTDTTDLNIVLGSNAYGCAHGDIAVSAFELDAMRKEPDFAVVCRGHRGLGSDRPQAPVQAILHIDPLSPGIVRGICAPARQLNIVPAAES